MGKQKIGAKEAVNDIRSGMSDVDLMNKYNLTARGLDSLFVKLVEANLLEQRFLSQRTAAAPQGSSKKPQVPPAGVVEGTAPCPQDPPELLAAIAEGIKGGLHDTEIMRRHELSPGRLAEIKAKLVQAGYLEPAHIEPLEGGKTKRCPFCSKEIKESASRCLHCGQWLESAPSAEARETPPLTSTRPEIPPREHALHRDIEEDKECPWEERANYGTLNAYFQTATRCLLTPTLFFSKLPLRDGYFSPVLFAAFTGVVSIVIGYLLLELFSGGRMGGLGLIGLLVGVSVIFVGSLIVFPISIGIWSGILHVCLYLLGGAKEGYQATFRVVSYSSVANLFGIIPVVGNIASLWSLVLTVIGLRETHKTATGKSVAALAIPLGVIILFSIVFVAIAGLKIASQLKSGFAKQQHARPVVTQSYADWNLPPQVCAALDEYIARVDAAASLDAESGQATVRDAINEFDKVLNQFQNEKHIPEVKQRAKAYGFGVLAQSQLSQKLGGKADMLKSAWDNMRNDLRRMCGK